MPLRKLLVIYKYGFVTEIASEKAPKGLNEDIIRFISEKKSEPEWMLKWRLKAYRYWLKMSEPNWSKLSIAPIDYNDIYYYSAPKSAEKLNSLADVDPELLATYEKLGIPLNEQKMLAVSPLMPFLTLFLLPQLSGKS